MSTPEDYKQDNEQLTLDEMRDVLFEAGWEISEEDDFSKFSRNYARVNKLLDGSSWKEVTANFLSIVYEEAPNLPKGIALGVDGDETEVKVWLHADQNDINDVTKVYMLNSYLKEFGFEDVEEDKLFEWLKLKGEPGTLKLGSKDHYESQPRSAELRSICLEFIENYANVAVSEGMEGGAMSRLLDLNQRLVQLEIEPEMHVGASRIEFIDPIKRTEWVSGQLMSILQQGLGLSGNARAIIEEHDLLNGENDGLVMIDMQSKSEAPSLAILLSGLESLLKMLDAELDNEY